MEPKHTVEYALTTEMAAEIQRTLLPVVLRHAWRRDVPVILGWLVAALLLAGPVLAGWLSPGVGGGLLFLATLLTMGAMYGRRWRAYSVAGSAVIALHTPDRRVRLEFHDERVCMLTEYLRGEAAWSELEELLEFPTFWALRFSNSGVIAIPAAQVTAELKAFLRAKAMDAARASLTPR